MTVGTVTVHGMFRELTMVEPGAKAKKQFLQLPTNAQPTAESIARYPVGTVWFKATPAAGDYMAWTKTDAAGTVKECLAIAA